MEKLCGKAPATREEAKAEHRRFIAVNPGVSAGIPYLCPYSGQREEGTAQGVQGDKETGQLVGAIQSLWAIQRIAYVQRQSISNLIGEQLERYRKGHESELKESIKTKEKGTFS